MADPHPVLAPAIVIAAGGAGTRMGGDKPGRLLAGQRLIDHVIAWARRHGADLALAVSAIPPAPDPSGLPLLVDTRSAIGPIAALHSAMVHAAARGHDRVMLVGCDTPFLPDDLVSRLDAVIGPGGAALPRRGGRLHTLAGLWLARPAALERWIDAGGRSPWGYAEAAGLVVVDWPDRGEDPFANLNTPEDLARAAARLARQVTAPGR